MKIIVDAQLPESICDFFNNCDCIHTKHLKNKNLTKDPDIIKLSMKEKRVVITKDSDFYYSFLTSQKPYKLVLVKLGNMRLKDLKNYFKSNAANIISILKNHSFIILEKNTIKILQ